MYYVVSKELCHHGILGQKWGVRRYQNPDGSLTTEGKKRYYNSDGSLTKYGQRLYNQDARSLGSQYSSMQENMYRTFVADEIQGNQYDARRFSNNAKIYMKNFDMLYKKAENRWGSDKMKEIYKTDDYKACAAKGRKYLEEQLELQQIMLEAKNRR